MMQSMWTIRYAQFMTFALIGVANTMIHGIVLVLAVEGIQLNVTLSNGFGFLIANVFSYVANSRLTFKTTLSLNRYIRFFLASILSLGLTLLISYAAERYGLHYLKGFALIIILVPLFSYLVVKFLAFNGIGKTAMIDKK